MKRNRPTVLNFPIILLILSSLLFWLLVFFPSSSRDPDLPVVLYASAVLGVLGLVAAFGIFTLKRWGVILSICVSVPSALFGVGDIVYSSSLLIRGLCIALVALYALVIVLVIRAYARQAYAPERKHVAS